MNKKIVLVSDFDGTISKQDFFYMVIDNILPKDTDVISKWKDYLSGKIKHIDVLNAIFNQIHLPQNELDKFISTIQIDTTFEETAQYCYENKISFYICSAGTNYYIKKRIPDILEKYKINLISNDSTYNQIDGLKLTVPSKDLYYYHENTGISKRKIVEKLKKDGCFVIYAGDGKPDFTASKIADIVFAKDLLLELCNKEHIKVNKLNTFADILNYMRQL